MMDELTFAVDDGEPTVVVEVRAPAVSVAEKAAARPR
jgi:hypothetical protein